MPVITDGVTETATTTDQAGVVLSDTLTDVAKVATAPHAGLGLTLAQTMGMNAAQSFSFYAGAEVSEIIKLQLADDPTCTFGLTAAEILHWSDAARAAWTHTVVENLGMHEIVSGTLAALVLEHLGMLGAGATQFTYLKTVLERVRMTDALRRFFSGEVIEGIGVTLNSVPVFRPSPVVTEAVGMHDALTPYFILRAVAADVIEVNHEQALQWIFSPTLSDGIEITAGYVAPNGNFTTWTINTRSGATTEYTNFNFNSFAQMGRRFVGASEQGLYELDGDTDDGAAIIATLQSGYASFGTTKLSSFAAAYLGMRGTGDVYLKLLTGDGKTYTYKVTLDTMQNTKVWIGKGLRARYFAFELITTGQDFDLDDIEFVPLVASRRV